MYFIYILECEDNTLYTGITTDVERRFMEHKSGEGANYTRAHGASKILYTEECKNRSEASKRESVIKKLSREEKFVLIKTHLSRI
jgi:putative endonuclease